MSSSMRVYVIMPPSPTSTTCLMAKGALILSICAARGRRYRHRAAVWRPHEFGGRRDQPRHDHRNDEINSSIADSMGQPSTVGSQLTTPVLYHRAVISSRRVTWSVDDAPSTLRLTHCCCAHERRVVLSGLAYRTRGANWGIAQCLSSRIFSWLAVLRS
jgi:hypothetical protein